ncbi:MAG: hypothetical protein HWE10_04810 [Gammaproteobacteria bacterium]|nr:hypothetical protein [Gammaproteobacteria bacterium]
MTKVIDSQKQGKSNTLTEGVDNSDENKTFNPTIIALNDSDICSGQVKLATVL